MPTTRCSPKPTGAADLRRELNDSKAAVAERTEILKIFAECKDSQRAWLLLEDYFENFPSREKISAAMTGGAPAGHARQKAA